MFQTAATFTGSFGEDCQVKSVPQSLLTLVGLISTAPTSSLNQGWCNPSNPSPSQFCSTIAPSVAEWVALLCVTTKTEKTPLPSTWTHSPCKDRKRDLIEMVFDLGLSISYDRVMAISTSMGNRGVSSITEMRKCAPQSTRGLFHNGSG
ncbi:hypothetical protein GWK47_025596 [Chionoecetes opilio]|uniref:Uncharacterized protein n=1 Tax=Chionoecetes opilio TaxID=41210 RepID=A0A8J8WF68_CHIOP|nr:hypothetical protein GWK47_025596 [Chionoecetes opilio]